MKKIRNLTDLISALNITVIISSLVSVILLSSIFFLSYFFYFKHKRTQDYQEIITTNKLVQSSLSEKLSIIANSPIFIQYLHSGEITRNNMNTDLMMVLSTLKAPIIIGMTINKKHEGIIFKKGDFSNFYITLHLCYSGMNMDNEAGDCNNYDWTLFFSTKAYINSLNSYNNAIDECTGSNCFKLNILDRDSFGSFYVKDWSNKIIFLKINNQMGIFIWYLYAIYLITIFLITILNYKRINSIINIYIAKPIQRLTDNLQKNSFKTNSSHDNLIEEIVYLEKEIDEFKNKEQDAKLGIIATQVAHDIRSPLAAMDMAMNSITALPENDRVFLRGSINRIRDITNNLLTNYKFSHADDLKENQRFYLISEIESLISEKRMQFGNKTILNYSFTVNAYSFFVDKKIIEIKRVLSNLINNAVDAAVNNKSEVNIEIQGDQGFVYISIHDNGIGVSKAVLDNLGRKRNTYGKKEGSGLGLHHAVATLNMMGGTFDIVTRPLIEGTQVKIGFPLSAKPLWFIAKISLQSCKYLIILDDDETIHNIWQEKFKESILEKGIIVEHFYNNKELELWLFSDKKNLSTCIFLIDYEIIGSQINGLDLIQQFHLEPYSILVTSRYNESEIQSICENKNIALLPKSMSIYIPIE